MKERFVAGSIEAGQWIIDRNRFSIEQIIHGLMSQDDVMIDGHGTLRLAEDEVGKISASPPTLLHPEGLNQGNRLAILSVSGGTRYSFVPQPETDWMLKAGEKPFDSFNELSTEYNLGIFQSDRALLEIVAPTAVEVSAKSSVNTTDASIGIWTTNALDKSKVRLNYRVLEKGKLIKREGVPGTALSWCDGEQNTTIGMVHVPVPKGAVVQAIACYEGHAHHQRWFADPKIFQNPRYAVLSSIDPSGDLIRSYLLPELPAKGKAADDFEAAVCWMLWALGFATSSFGIHPKTRDAYDIVAVSPQGDFIVVECTLGLLRADSKLSKLGARAAQLRETLDASEMRHLRVLPVIVTAMSKEQVTADLTAAAQIGILVLTKENIENSFIELLRLPDANFLYSKAIQAVEEAKTSTMQNVGAQ